MRFRPSRESYPPPPSGRLGFTDPFPPPPSGWLGFTDPFPLAMAPLVPPGGGTPVPRPGVDYHGHTGSDVCLGCGEDHEIHPAPVGYGAAQVPGVAVNAGVNLTAAMRSFLQQLHARIPDVPITVTSGYRTPEEQASAMLKKLDAGGAKELYDVYADDATVSALLKAPKSTASWTAIIKARAPNLSRHMSGRAVDLHTRTLSATHQARLKAAAEALGGRTLLEDAPPHLHVDLPAGLAAASMAETAGHQVVAAGKRVAALWLGATLVGLVVVGTVIAVDRARRASRGVPHGVPQGAPHGVPQGAPQGAPTSAAVPVPLS